MDATQVRARLPWLRAIDALEHAIPSAFQNADFIDRTTVTAHGGHMLLMPAVSERTVGLKVVGAGNGNAALGLPRVHALYIALDAQSLSPVAVLDGSSLTTIRTAGQSAMVVRSIADPGARTIVVFGTGPQARAHVEAICAVRDIEAVGVVGRRAESVAACCASLSHLSATVEAATPLGVATADVVVCATSSSVPVFDGADLPERVCVVAVGSHTPEARELDDVVFKRAAVVLVEHRETALREAGDIVQAIANGALVADGVRDFGDLAEDRAGPTNGISVYKSVGMAYQDLAVVECALGLGKSSTCS